MSSSSIIQEDDGWYYLDETEDIGGGPYANEYLASAAQILYCLLNLGSYSREDEKSLRAKYIELKLKGESLEI